jgi:hypothetical protein
MVLDTQVMPKWLKDIENIVCFSSERQKSAFENPLLRMVREDSSFFYMEASVRLPIDRT